MTQRQKVFLRFRNVPFKSFEVTTIRGENKVTITPDTGFFAEKLGIGPGCMMQTNGASFTVKETIDEIKELMKLPPIQMEYPRPASDLIDSNGAVFDGDIPEIRENRK